MSCSKETNHNQVIIEVGNTYMRGGFIEELPRFILPSIFTLVTNEKDSRCMRTCCLEAMTVIFMELLQINSKDAKVVIVESFVGHKGFRECLYQVLFEDMHVASVSFQPDMLMALISTGLTSGVVLDVGSVSCRAVAIAYGRVISTSYSATSCGVNDCVSWLKHKLAVNQVKNELCNNINNISIGEAASLFGRAAAVYDTAINDATASDDLRLIPGEWTHLSGIVQSSMVRSAARTPLSTLAEEEYVVSRQVRQNCVNMLLEGNDQYFEDCFEDEVGGAPGLLVCCLQKCNADIRQIVAQSVVVCGGGAGIPGLAEVICKRATQLCKLRQLHGNTKENICSTGQDVPCKLEQVSLNCELAPATFNKTLLSWMGGCIFASLKSNQEQYIKYEEYIRQSYGLFQHSDVNESLDLNGKDTEDTEKKLGSKRYRMPDWLSTDPLDWKFF